MTAVAFDRFLGLVLSGCLAVGLLALSLPVPAEEALSVEARRIETAQSPSIADTQLFSGRLLAAFYADRNYAPAWDPQRARSLLGLARASRADGFDPDDFHASAIERVLDEDFADASGAARIAADILLSDALLRYIHHFRFGKYNPRHISPGWIFVDKADAEGLKADMSLVLAAGDPATELRAMLPDPVFYRNLKKGYERHLAASEGGELTTIPGGPNITIGMLDPRVPAIRERLATTDGFLPATTADPNRYDSDLADAVKDLQRRSGLGPDGIIGPKTLHVLNKPLDERLRKIRANLERMRWLYNDLPEDYLFVDITAYELRLVRDHETAWSTRVIIGKHDTPTPMFRDELEHLVFNPTWSVPQSIQKKMGGASSSYQIIERRTGRRVSGVDATDVDRYRLVQPPGPKNALGRVKFMFPNGHAIYLHDTPSRGLFSSSERAYSHGCVRVKDPLKLAELVLNRPSWSQPQIDRVLERGRTRYVHLEYHLPVLLYYLTAAADDRGRVGFRPDVYALDEKLLAMLDKPAHLNRIAFREPEAPAPAPNAEEPEDTAASSGPHVSEAPANEGAETPPEAEEGADGDAPAEPETRPKLHLASVADSEVIRLSSASEDLAGQTPLAPNAAGASRMPRE
jgi:murein L,D-transpeptidase YcbB/YkuD